MMDPRDGLREKSKKKKITREEEKSKKGRL